MANETVETVLKLRDKGRGFILLTLRDGVVIGAMGSEPIRFVGKSERDARHIARYGAISDRAKRAADLSAMVGCRVSYRGHDALIVSVDPDLGAPNPGMLNLVWDGGSAIVRPSEVA